MVGRTVVTKTTMLIAGALLASVMPAVARSADADVQQARAETERLRDVVVALGEGYVPASSCVTRPGEGAVGIRHVHPVRNSDSDLDVSHPEALLYLPEAAGEGRRLVALEYSVPMVLRDVPPELFGQTFSPSEQGDRWMLRVWLFSDNPAGTFAPANPREGCSAAELVEPDGAATGCHEVHAVFAVDAHMVRNQFALPADLRLREDDDGKAEVFVGGFSCDTLSLGAAKASPLLFSHVQVIIEPEWGPADLFGVTRWEVRMHLSDRDVTRELRRSTGWRGDVVSHSTRLSREIIPLGGLPMVAGSGDERCASVCDYRFTAPDFVLTAKITDVVPVAPTVWVRMLQRAGNGVGAFRPILDQLATGIATDAAVMPRPGTPLAALLCSGSDSCASPARAAVVAFPEAALLADAG